VCLSAFSYIRATFYDLKKMQEAQLNFNFRKTLIFSINTPQILHGAINTFFKVFIVHLKFKFA